MEIMALLNTALILITVFLCNCEVQSEVIALMTTYSLPNTRVILGRNHIDKKRWTYALCSISADERTALCDLKLVPNAFKVTLNRYSCPVNLATTYTNGKVDILGIELYGKEKVIFTWRDLNYDNIENGNAIVEVMHVPSCQSRKQTIMIDNRPDLKPQIFIIPSVNSFIVSFRNKNKCGDSFCKMTVYEDDRANKLVPWFRRNALVNALNSFEDQSNMFMLITDEYGMNMYNLLENSQSTEVARVEKIDAFGWSISNGVIALCESQHCVYANRDGTKELTLKLKLNPSKYAALYNLPYRAGHLAVVCNNEIGDNYHIMKIGIDGNLVHIYNLKGVQCSSRYTYMTAQFYMESEGNYCLDLAYSRHTTYESIFMNNYCFYA